MSGAGPRRPTSGGPELSAFAQSVGRNVALHMPLVVWAGGYPAFSGPNSGTLTSGTLYLVPTTIERNFTLRSYYVMISSVGAATDKRFRFAFYKIDFTRGLTQTPTLYLILDSLSVLSEPVTATGNIITPTQKDGPVRITQGAYYMGLCLTFTGAGSPGTTRSTAYAVTTGYTRGLTGITLSTFPSALPYERTIGISPVPAFGALSKEGNTLFYE